MSSALGIQHEAFIGSSGTSGPLILVVDASPIDRRVVCTLLETNLSARTATANNGRDALRVLGREHPLLVLTDMLMPEMDGLQFVKEVRLKYPLLPIILMTASGSEEMALRALQAGAASYVPKRSLDEQLVATVETVLAAARRERRRGHVLESLKRLECEFELENDPALVPHFIAHLQEQMIRMGLCTDDTKIRIGVALEEALLNGLYHGNLELSSDLRNDGGLTFYRMAEERRHLPFYRDRRLHVQVRFSVREASFIIRDEGPGFDVSNLPDPTNPENLLKASGRGLLLIRMFMDEVFHNSKGNQITLVQRGRSS